MGLAIVIAWGWSRAAWIRPRHGGPLERPADCRPGNLIGFKTLPMITLRSLTEDARAVYQVNVS